MPRAAAKRPRPSRGKIAAVVVTVVLVALVAGVVGGFAWVRWFSSSDTADMQGTWYLAGTSTPITITEDRIQLTDEVSYPYTLDTGSKTIEFSFSHLSGAGCYRFSLDRQQLALVDGTFTAFDTLTRDAEWMVQAVIAQVQGETLPPAEAPGKGVTLLSRTPTSAAAGAAGEADGAGEGGQGDTPATGATPAEGDAPADVGAAS